jgi:hypothetical protein
MSFEADRRRFRRVQAPVLCRPIGRKLFGARDKGDAIDISQGGLRIYADDPMSPGDRLEIELFLPDGSTVECEVEIVWVEELTMGQPARFDMGLRFLDASADLIDRLGTVLLASPAA